MSEVRVYLNGELLPSRWGEGRISVVSEEVNAADGGTKKLWKIRLGDDDIDEVVVLEHSNVLVVHEQGRKFGNTVFGELRVGRGLADRFQIRSNSTYDAIDSVKEWLAPHILYWKIWDTTPGGAEYKLEMWIGPGAGLFGDVVPLGK
jgi:hypothetical protein